MENESQIADEAIGNREQIEDIKRKLKSGEITYNEAQEMAIPVINRINQRGKEVAKRHGRRWSLIGFTYLMR